MGQIYGSWQLSENNAGGSSADSYWLNPQYLIKINEPAKLVTTDTTDDLSSIIICLMQSYSARMRYQSDGAHANSFHWIKFHLYAVASGVSENELRGHVVQRARFEEEQLRLIDSSGAYGQQRAVTKRCYVSPGYYVIVPSTFDANIETEYLLRIFHEKFSIDLLYELH